MYKKLTEKKLKRFHKLLSEPVTTFDCGTLCKSKDNGMPFCCDNSVEVPILLKEELRWLNRQKRFWKRMPVKTKADKALVEDGVPYYKCCNCPGPDQCDREMRSITCRIFPFEPYLDKNGKIIGLVFINRKGDRCPLIGKPVTVFNKAFIKDSLKFWKEWVDLIEDEKELYIDESRKRLNRAKRKKESLSVFTADARRRRSIRIKP